MLLFLEASLPIISKLGDMYVTASHETANVEREFSKQNLVMTNLRNKLTIASMSQKVCNKEYDKILGKDETEKVLVGATKSFINMKPRRPYQLGHHK